MSARRTFLETAAAVVVIAGMAAAQTTSPALPAAASGVAFDQRLGETVPIDLPLAAEDGSTVTLRDVAGGKPLVLVLVWFRCPMLCGEMTNGVLRSLRGVSLDAGRDFRVAFVSIDPREGPDLAAQKQQAVCAAYGREGCREGLRFLTGSADATAAIAGAVGYRYRWDEQSKSYAHPAGIVVITPSGTASRYLFGVDYPPRDLRLAILDSAAGKTGTLADRLLMLCFHYDPATGRYGLAIRRGLQIAGVVTVAAIAAAIWRLSRRRPRPSAVEG